VIPKEARIQEHDFKDLPTPNNQNSATIDAKITIDSSVTYETESEIFSSVNEQYIGDNEYD